MPIMQTVIQGGGTTPTGPNVKIINNNGEAYFGAIDLTGIQYINEQAIFQQNYQNSTFKYATGDAFLNADSLITISGQGAFLGTFGYATGITSVNLPNLTTVSVGRDIFNNTFYNCTGLISVNLPNLTTVGNGSFAGTFFGCTNLKSIYLPKITSNSYVSRPNFRDFFAFDNSGLEICDLRNLETVGDYGLFDNILNGTAALKKVNINAVTHIGTEAARAFVYLSSSSSTLTDLYFPMLTTFGTNPFYTNAFSGREGLTIHFRKDAQATVEALANYATLWGAGAGSSVAFDLAGTLTGGNSNAYARAEKYSVYASETAGAAKTATAWIYNNTRYYTFGGAEPSVGDTIYSDSACTQAVTTISSIA